MAFIQRNAAGQISGIYAVAQPGYAEEFLGDADPAVAAYLQPTTPDMISDRQFFQQLAVQGVITQDEAIAAVATGTLPASMEQLVATLPADQQFGAKMLLKGATQFARHHPMVAVLGRAYGWTDAQLDALWGAAAAL